MLTAFIHLLGAAPDLAGTLRDQFAEPFLRAAEFLIPAAVIITGLHKMMEHRESGGSFLVDMVTKGGGAVLLIEVVRVLAGMGA